VDTYPGIKVSHDLDATLAGADVVTVFTGHHHYASLDPARVKKLSGEEHPVVVDGRNVVEPDVFIRAGFIYKGIGRGDKNSHPIR
jgi:UDP-N-acetyl-D-mannosaminuronic acid dehydrogenase